MSYPDPPWGSDPRYGYGQQPVTPPSGAEVEQPATTSRRSPWQFVKSRWGVRHVLSAIRVAAAWVMVWLRKRRADNIAYIWLAPVALWAVIWLLGSFFSWLAGGHAQEFHQTWGPKLFDRMLLPQQIHHWADIPNTLWHATGWFYTIVLICLGVSVLVWNVMRPNPEDNARWREVLFHSIAVLLIIVTGSRLAFAVLGDDKDSGNWDSQATTIVVNDIHNLPESTDRLAEGLEPGDGKPCQLVSGSGRSRGTQHNVHDTHACVVQGDLDYHWEDRIGSANAAKTILGRSGSGAPSTYLMEKTITYLHGDRVGEGMWSGIRDGSWGVGAYGIATMDRFNNPDACVFDDQYELSLSFSGNWSHNLRGALANKFPRLIHHDENVWGYCTANREPIIVVLPTRYVGKQSRAMETTAGVTTIRGSPSGEPVITHYDTVQPGRRVGDLTLPGPVYPPSLVVAQRDNVQWIAGRDARRLGKFGYDPAPAQGTDDSNMSEHLRREIKADGTYGDEYWVTPLTARSTDALTFLGYSKTRADLQTPGRLNETQIMVYNEKDPNDPTKPNPGIVELKDLTSNVKNMVARVNPGFVAPGVGSIVEYIPRTPQMWLAFGEIDGRVVYRFEVPTNSRIMPTIIDLDTGKTLVGPTTHAGNEVCFDPAQMSTQQSGVCLAAIGDALKDRKGTEPEVKPSSSPSAAPSPAPSR